MSEQQTVQSYFLPRGQSVKGPHTNVRRTASPTGQIVRGGIPGLRYTDKEFNTTPLPESYIEYARTTKDTNGKTKLENMLASGVIVTEPGLEMPPTISPVIGSELTVSPISGRITEDAK